MVAWIPAARTAMKVAPFAFEAARQLDRQLRPHVLAYRLARDVDGFVGRWTSSDGGHWVVFPRRDAEPLRSFPPLVKAETEIAASEIDRTSLRHHSELPEARVATAASRFGSGGRSLPSRGAEPIDVEVIEINRDEPPR